MPKDPSGRITLRCIPDRIRVRAGGTLIADSRNPVELREIGYPPRRYLPRSDVVTARLQPSTTTSHCPFKGDATYYNLILDDGVIADAAWSYEAPYAAMAAIRGHIAFDSSELVELAVDDDSETA